MITLIKFLISTIFLLHVGFTVLYLVPLNPTTNYYQEITQNYMNTFFTQDWKLFSPEPALYSLKMYYSCTPKISDGKWKDPLDNLIRIHQKNRFLFKGKAIYVYQGVYRRLLNKKIEILNNLHCNSEKENNCLRQVSTEIKKTAEFSQVNKLVTALCLDESKSTSHEFKIIKSYPIPFSKRNQKDARPIVSVEFSSEVTNGFQPI